MAQKIGSLIQTNRSRQTCNTSLKAFNPADRERWLAMFPNQQRFLLKATPLTALTFLEKPKLVWWNKYPTMGDIIALFPQPMQEWYKAEEDFVLEDKTCSPPKPIPIKAGQWYTNPNDPPLTSERAVLRFIATNLASYLLNTPQKTAPTAEQLQEMAMQLYATMKPYTIAEIMLFFALLKTGYWKMFNKGNIQEILELFRHEFKDYRNIMIDDVESEKRDIEREIEATRAVSYEQVLEMQKRGELPPFQNKHFIEFVEKTKE